MKNFQVGELKGDDKYQVVELLGRQSLTEIYRQVLVSVITELWVDYLTQMEALRISIGLEAYAQRDPLVQYKNRAFALFQELLSNMRLAVVSRMFAYRPRDTAMQQTDLTDNGVEITETSSGEEPKNVLVVGNLSEKEENDNKVVEMAGTAVSEVKPNANQESSKSGGGKRKRRRRH